MDTYMQNIKDALQDKAGNMACLLGDIQKTPLTLN